MDAKRFEELSRRVGAAGSRRGAVKVLAGALLGSALLDQTLEPASAQIPIVNCRPPGQKCRRDVQCCSTRCKNRLCQCAPNGQQCWTPLEGALCCSRRCRNGKCAS